MQLPTEVLEAAVEFLTRSDLETMQLVSRRLCDLSNASSVKNILRYLQVTVENCHSVSMTLLNDGPNGTQGAIREVEFNELEPLLRRSVVATLDFEITFCECMLRGLRTVAKELKYSNFCCKLGQSKLSVFEIFLVRTDQFFTFFSPKRDIFYYMSQKFLSYRSRF